VPRVIRGMGETLVGPSVIVHGTQAQREYFLPRIVSGEDVYCQGFSEPGHGSDLAAVETRGEVDGDEIVITGQKVWTSGAVRASEDEGARRELLPGIASGETIATLAFTEDDGSWDPSSIRMAAAKNGPGWRLDGHKSFVLDGHGADVIVTVASADIGLSLFAVDGTAAGLSRRVLPTLDQTRRLARCEFSEVPARLIGSPGTAGRRRGDVEDPARAAFAHPGQDQRGQVERRLDLDREHQRVASRGELLDTRSGSRRSPVPPSRPVHPSQPPSGTFDMNQVLEYDVIIG
jgi:alkylation response protein AidB-like acyl-CoA dehydrogenase